MIPNGLGVEIRHRRKCALQRRENFCSCEPSFRAWVYDRKHGKKERRTFTTRAVAREWRLKRLRKMYNAADLMRIGKADVAYGFLRKSAQELDRSISGLSRPAQRHAREALARLYDAEDALLNALTEDA